MLGALAFEAVGQKQNDAAEVPPLFLGADDKLIDDHLGHVGEIAELSFPEHQGVGIAQAIAVLEPSTPASDKGLLIISTGICSVEGS